MFLKNKSNEIELVNVEDADEGQYESIDPQRFLTFDEIVEDLPIRISEEDSKFFSEMKGDDHISLHHTFGRWIRNSYGLWESTNPFTDISENVAMDSDEHPDNYSGLIIEAFHKSISEKMKSIQKQVTNTLPISTEGLPFNTPVLATLRNCLTGRTLTETLILVDEDDCSWRIKDGNHELSYNYDVISWKIVIFNS